MIIAKTSTVPWLPFDHVAQHILTSTGPDPELVSTVHGFFFYHGKLVGVRHDRRGWEMPGGHREAGESCVTAMLRELYEEAQAIPEEVFQIGYLRMESKVAVKPASFRKPFPVSYSVFFAGVVRDVDVFVGDDEIVERKLMTRRQACMTPWTRRYREFMDEAYTLVRPHGVYQ